MIRGGERERVGEGGMEDVWVGWERVGGVGGGGGGGGERRGGGRRRGGRGGS